VIVDESFAFALINEITTSQTRLRTSPIVALVNRIVPLPFTRQLSFRSRCRLIEPSFPRARARKNYQRSFYRYREIAERIGLHEWSAI
jgi:hypothetical protein